MSGNLSKLTHVAGTFLIQADGAFLNGAGLGAGDDKNVTVPKTFRDGRNDVPYVSAQAWKRWLRTTAGQEAGWSPSLPQAIGWNPEGNVKKIAGQLNPVEFPEDDIFGYMYAREGQGRRKTADEEEDEPGEQGDRKVKSVMRASPFAASVLVSLRSTGWRGDDEGFVHLTKFDHAALAEAEVERFLDGIGSTRDKQKDAWRRLEGVNEELSARVKAAALDRNLGELRELLTDEAKKRGKASVAFIQNPMSPLPYTTRFYNTHLQGIFCLDYARLGVFWNVGDRLELEEEKARRFLADGKIEEVTKQPPYDVLTDNGRAGRIFRIADASKVRKERAAALLKSLAVLRGGAKQAQFGTDVAPKVLILAGLLCGNPIFNHLFKDESDGPLLKLSTFKEVIADYADRIVTPVVIGLRSGYLKNESDIRASEGWYRIEKGPLDGTLTGLKGPFTKRESEGRWVQVTVTTPVDASKLIGEVLP